jgi:hypothetical protein
MTGTDDESGASEGDGSGEGSDQAPRNSRFDAFFDRLDERASADHQSLDTDDSSDDEAAGGTECETEENSASEVRSTMTALSGSSAAEDDWIWGSPRATGSRDSALADPGQGRLWNIGDDEPDAPESGLDELLEVGSDAVENPPASDEDDSADDAADPDSPPVSDPSSLESAADTRDGGGTDSADVDRESESDRWSELGSTLGSSSDRSTGSERRADDVETGDASIPADRADQLDVPTSSDALSGPDSPSATGSGVLGGDQASELDRVTSASSVLLLGPGAGTVSEGLCSRFLTGADGSRDVIFVTFEQSPSDRIEICHHADEWTGGNIGVIEVGRGSRNAPVSSEITGEESSGTISVRHVSRPGDLSKLGIVITQLLSEFDTTGRQTVLCFHTLSALHQQIGTKTLFRFLNTLQGRLNATDTLGHYHMNPELHDEIVIDTLRPVFERIVRFSEAGDLEIE